MHGLRCVYQRPYRKTTQSDHDKPAAPNLVDRQFGVQPADRVWIADISYIATAEGWLYLAAVLDLGTRRVVGWSMSSRMPAKLVCDALAMAYFRRRPRPGLITHSDRGAQYASAAYRRDLAKHGMRQSMSRKGNVWDNAPMESFFKTLKVERVYGQRYETREQACLDIVNWMEGFYNRKRMHSALGYRHAIAFAAAVPLTALRRRRRKSAWSSYYRNSDRATTRRWGRCADHRALSGCRLTLRVLGRRCRRSSGWPADANRHTWSCYAFTVESGSAMAPNRRSRKSPLAIQTAELAWSVPQVIAHRLSRLALAGSSPSARDRREFQRMSVEKVAAFFESWNAMYVEGIRTYLSLARSPFFFWWSPWTGPTGTPWGPRTAFTILSSGLAPIHRRARVNARRLRGTRIV